MLVSLLVVMACHWGGGPIACKDHSVAMAGLVLVLVAQTGYQASDSSVLGECEVGHLGNGKRRRSTSQESVHVVCGAGGLL